MNKKNHKQKWILCGFSVLLLYIAIWWMAFDIYWGESSLFITRSFVLGSANPPGYPLFITLMWPIQKMPIGDVAFRSNVFNGILYSILGLILFTLFNRFVKNYLLSLIMTSLFLLSQPILRSISAVEVYILNIIFFVVLILIITEQNIKKSHSYLMFFLIGISLAHHITTVLYAAVFIYYIYKRIHRHLIFREILFFILGWSVNIHLIIREKAKKLFVWGNPDNISGFIKLISASEESKASFKYGISNVRAIEGRLEQIMLLIRNNLLIFGIIFIILGIICLFQKDKRLSKIFGSILIVFVVAVSLYDSNESESFFLPGLLIVYFYLSFGLSCMLEKTNRIGTKTSIVLKGIVILACVLLLFNSISYIKEMRCSEKSVPRMLVKNILIPVDENEIVLTRRSDMSFLLSYFKNIENWCSFVPVFQHLLSFNWYYQDLIRMNAGVNEKLMDMKFEDSMNWNSAVTASVIKYNMNRSKTVWLCEPEIITDINRAGLKKFNMIINGFCLGLTNDMRFRSCEYIKLFKIPERIEPLSRSVLSMEYYIASLFYGLDNNIKSSKKMKEISFKLLHRVKK